MSTYTFIVQITTTVVKNDCNTRIEIALQVYNIIRNIDASGW